MTAESESIQGDVDAIYFDNKKYVAVDAAIYKTGAVPFARFPWLVRISIQCHSQDEYGFPTAEEQPNLIAVIQPLVDIVHASDPLPVGRVSSGGVRNYFFYCSLGDELTARLDQEAGRHIDYVVKIECMPDPEWRYYVDEISFLPDYNTEKNMIKLVLQQLHSMGDDLTEAREYNHVAEFPRDDLRQKFIEWGTSRGFKCNPVEPDAKAEGNSFKLWLSRSEVPDWYFLNGTIFELMRAVSALGGKFSSDGCMAVINKQAKADAKP